MMNKGFCKVLLISGAVIVLGLLTACHWVSGASQTRTPSPMIAKGRIEGSAVDEERRPVTQVVIVIATTTATGEINEMAPVTNEQGEFGFPDLPPGQYTLRATRDGYKPQTLTVTVTDGKTIRADFVMRK